MRNTRIGDIPPFFCKVRREFLLGHQEGHDTYENGVAIGVVCRKDMALAFTVLLESGALWYDVPIHGICTAECEPRELSLLQQWDCLSDDFTVHAYEPLKTLKVVANQDSLPLGTYMFTIDFLGSFYADDPGEHKTLNVIELVTGHLVAMPNNKLLFEDKTFTKITDWPKYVRTDRHYYAEE